MNPIDQIIERLDRYGGADYGDERVTQLAHALQCAAQAEAEGADAALISAALLHDIGHLVHDLGPSPAARGIDDRHETRGEEWLSHWFDEAVTAPVRLHVDAKRYLTGTDPEYFATLSPGSVRTISSSGRVHSVTRSPLKTLRRWGPLISSPRKRSLLVWRPGSRATTSAS